MQYIKYRTEALYDYFHCEKTKCQLNRVKQWLNLYVDRYNK